MFNEIHLGPITVYMYGIMIFCGYMAALRLCLWRGRKQGLSEDTVWGIFFCALVGGLIGCKLLYYIVELPQIIADPSLLLDFGNGLVVYGGIIGGVLSSYLYVRLRRHEIFLPYFDLVMPAVAIAQGFGRIGCFCAGCCWGKETDSWCHVVFTRSAFAPNGVPLIPTQLISSAGDFLIGILLMLYARKKPSRGRVGALYLILYGIGRFAVEFLRDDPRGSVGPLSTSQFISLLVVAGGVVLFCIKWPDLRPAAVEADDLSGEIDGSLQQ
ncbi:MAG: prolipoprotein diacylglyceryl transferase [Butyrivibrio sp.]|nr:prolipoprotein diacylglyceryl transferase [Butyrivibrio sp.]